MSYRCQIQAAGASSNTWWLRCAATTVEHLFGVPQPAWTAIAAASTHLQQLLCLCGLPGSEVS
jgi:hypothetical protein